MTKEAASEGPVKPDPRSMLADWANGKDEWTRLIVRLVLETGRPLSSEDVSTAFQLFLEEKGFSDRTIPVEHPLTVDVTTSTDEDTLVLKSISAVAGVNALTTNPEITLHDGLTIFFGENGAGKTGYARILKALANSRTADEILPDINDPSAPENPSATIKYSLDGVEYSKQWKGENGSSPFTRMSIFDTPAVNIHVDEDVTYVFTPAALALFNHVTQGIRGVQSKLQEAVESLGRSNTLLQRFDRGTDVYTYVETLGASTELKQIDKFLEGLGDNPEEDAKKLEGTVAALRANTLSETLKRQQRAAHVLSDALDLAGKLSAFVVSDYNESLVKLGALKKDYKTFRDSLFAAADLPTPPEDTWDRFIRAGSEYKEHLESEGAHDEQRCLYCRQVLNSDATGLVAKYKDYLEDKITDDIHNEERRLASLVDALTSIDGSAMNTYVDEQDSADSSEPLATLRKVLQIYDETLKLLNDEKPVEPKLLEPIKPSLKAIELARDRVGKDIEDLTKQLSNTAEALTNRTKELENLRARLTLQSLRAEVETFVSNSQRADKLDTLAKKFKPLLTSLTDLSTDASNQLINNNFEHLFKEECKALRANTLQLAFVGRDAKTKRKKLLKGSNYRPSKVLSEGEQKVLAIADFLAEARLTGIRAPIVFDDPVNSLDHRRLGEVADRITVLAEEGQVIVFTHDILLATGLLARFEKSKRCVYYQVTDEPDTGTVTHASGPRWDTLSNLKGKVNAAIQDATASQGDERAAHIRTAYDWMRSWCEVFVEKELLAGVTERYQPNVRMTALSNIKADALADAAKIVSAVFEDACRYIDGHSQPLATLSTAPSLKGLEDDWTKVQAARDQYLKA
jgi:energy-coupling factor transporter ATP-binding protein EcfA2